MTIEEAIRLLRRLGYQIDEESIFLMNQKAYRVNGNYRFADWILREAGQQG
jgi:hypothetical protein